MNKAPLRDQLIHAKYRKQNAVRLAAEQKAYRQDPRNKTKIRRRQRLRKYGLNASAYDEMWRAQRGRCGSCGDKLIEGRGTHVDHCHKRNKVRSLLCGGCNVAAGLLKDSAKRARLLAVYLEKHGCVC